MTETSVNPFSGLSDNLHVPLSVGMSMEQAVGIFSAFYLVTLDTARFKPSQAFVSSSGYITLELLDKNTGELLYTFVNRMQVVKDDTTVPVHNPAFEFINPLELSTPTINWLTGPVTITHLQEMEFLKDVPVNQPQAIENLINPLPFQLSTLLNNYGVLGRWVSGTLGELCTGGFTLLFYGPGQDAPAEYLISEAVDTVVLIEINQGSRQGVLCLQYLKAQ
ncbi:hypothetical protein NFI00_000055 [Salmonella enterica]|nr:hypothetical protein [Salmonella enterica subsp. enterica serovar Minnesota]EJI5696352.1 hypothetical protein [Salmonella enterica]